jgi:nanoRNase/pAp phosphatase (c-di-AMP/oligoRNAs hydrolase)
MDTFVFKQIKDLLNTVNTAAIVVGKNPSLDDMGAALSLFLSLSLSGKSVAIAAPDNPTVEISNLVGIDKVKTTLGMAGGDLVVSFPYRDGEIEKVSYTLENELLNIIVKAGPQGLNFSQRDVKFSSGASSKPNLLFIVGSPRLSDLSPIFDVADLKDTKVINIDNKSENQSFGDVAAVDTKSSSVSEIVASLILFLGLPMDQDISQNLFSGISFATSEFQDQNTSFLAFEMAGALMRNGARRMPLVRQRATNFEPLQVMQRPQQTMPPQMQQQPQQAARPNSTDVMERLRRQIAESQRRQEEKASNQPEIAPTVKKTNETAPIDQVEKEKQIENPPEDWLAPKIYKGSTNF